MIISSEFHFRDRFGKFMAVCDAAAVKSSIEMGRGMQRVARRQAPDGPPRQDYGRRRKLKPSIRYIALTRKTAAVRATAEHAQAIEEGAGPHLIPNAFGRGITVLHPGNAAQPFLDPAYQWAVRNWRGILAKNYPG